MKFWRVLGNILSFGVVPIIKAAARAKRRKREQQHRHKMEWEKLRGRKRGK
jgi:hypothetical protein